jgi:hypothetical protein
MKTAIKWLAIICVIGWAAHNPAQVSADIHGVLGIGQSLVGQVMNAGNSALSGVTGGAAPAAPAGH